MQPGPKRRLALGWQSACLTLPALVEAYLEFDLLVRHLLPTHPAQADLSLNHVGRAHPSHRHRNAGLSESEISPGGVIWEVTICLIFVQNHRRLTRWCPRSIGSEGARPRRSAPGAVGV